MSSESILQFLSQPATLASLAAITAAGMMFATRPTPMKCPVDPNQQSVEVPDENGARRSALSEKLVDQYFEGVDTLYEGFKRGLSLAGDKPCLGWRKDYDQEFQWLTYKEVDERALSFGSGLLDLGAKAGPETFIGIYSQNKVEWVLAEQGCNRFSMVIIPLYDTLGPDACTFIINQAQIKIIVCDEQKVETLLKNIDKCEGLKYIIKIGESVPEDEQEQAQKHGVEILTFMDVEERDPKGVMITHANMVAEVSAIQFLLEKCNERIGNNDVHISYLPLAHMYERAAHFMMFSTGARVGFFTGNIRKITEDLKALRPTIFISVPRLLNRIHDKVMSDLDKSSVKKFLFNMALSSKENELSRNIIRRDSMWDYIVFKKIQKTLGGRIRLVLSGSAPLSDRVMKFLRAAFGCFVFEGYGQTETTAGATLQLVGDASVGHVGPPLPCNMVKLVDVPDMDYYAKDGAGEVCYKGPNIFQGYLYDEEKTKEAFDEDGWLHSGDIGKWLPSGTLKIVDRKKNIFKLAQGEYIAPEKVEEIYHACPIVHQVFVTGVSTESCVVAIIVPEIVEVNKKFSGEMNDICSKQEVKEHILKEMSSFAKKAELRSFEQAKAIHLHPEPFSVENGYLTPTFKIKRPLLKKLFMEQIKEMYQSLN
ncbi:long-chain-fatty-acid--CoA ligase 5-like [Xenia sp. Carnegie-2017]|uniref:long-chain-fatty-acid--CoA ligase 5-like n=1 Tax=Xenia sp. Carnegie-2017 TaxID=2897299 RepID=UPI001F046658|nr:long-chain-fatty-acid--CoA ligase 5-like [Xenia sp. Carnegie-2017]